MVRGMGGPRPAHAALLPRHRRPGACPPTAARLGTERKEEFTMPRILDGDASPRTKTNFSHRALADAIISNPRATHLELSKLFGYSPTWISTVTNSDAFRVYLEERKAEIVDPVMRLTIEDRYRAMACRSVEVLMEKLHAPASVISDELALKAAALGATVLKTAAPVPVAPPESSIDRLADRLVALQQGMQGVTFRRTDVIDASPA